MSSALDSTFGATYIGVIVATFLYGIMTLQTYIYWGRYVHDSTFDRLFVLTLWLLDTFQMVSISHMQYHYVINNYANPTALLYNNWSFNLLRKTRLVLYVESFTHALVAISPFCPSPPLSSPVSSSVSTPPFHAHTILTHLKLAVTKRVGSRFTTTRRTQMMGAIILGFGLGAFAMVWVLGEFGKFIKYNWLVGGWLGAAALGDVIIVYMLSTALMSQRTGFGRTDALINKLLRYTINTGLLTSLIAIVDVVTFCTMNNLIHLGFNFMLGKRTYHPPPFPTEHATLTHISGRILVYTNTLLATLNSREIEPENVVHVESSSYRLGDVARPQVGTMKFAIRPMGASSQQDLNNGIQLHTDTQVQVAVGDEDPGRQSHKMVVLPGEGRDEEYDLDGGESMGSVKRSRAL
ncbi:hypothetical protein FRC07_002173 [Ceratobasidium sp. 392]|nr:hypothetical protein FRC07_002173 [Ceratobasidium sp. 392]